MKRERFVPVDEADEAHEAGHQDRRREWRRWFAQPDAWDPDRWKAMAAAWASMLQDGVGPARGEHGKAVATKPCPYCAEEIRQAAIKCKHCRTWLADPPEPYPHADGFAAYDSSTAFTSGYYRGRRLTRSTGDAMVYGVFSGLGNFFGIDPTWLRIPYALATFFTFMIPGILVYAILATIIPSGTPTKGPGVD